MVIILLSITDKTRVDTDSIILNTNTAVESHSDNNSPTIAIGNDGVLYLFYGGESQILYFKVLIMVQLGVKKKNMD